MPIPLDDIDRHLSNGTVPILLVPKCLEDAEQFRRDKETSLIENEILETCDLAFESIEDYQVAVENMIEFLGSKDCEDDTDFRVPPLFLDDSRKKLIHRIATNAYNLDFTWHRNLPNNSHCLIVTGPKGIGKTWLLLSIVVTLAVMSKRIIPLYCSYDHIIENAEDESILPSQIIYRALQTVFGKERLPDSETTLPIRGIFQFCGKLNIRIIFFADEFHCVYKRDTRTMRKIISQMRDIGNSTHSLITAVIAGSTAALPELCLTHFSTTPVEEFTHIYPLYRKASSLNNTRYNRVSLRPIMDRDSFSRLIQFTIENSSHKLSFMNRGLSSEDGISKLDYLAMVTGGRVRFVNNVLANGTDDGTMESLRRTIENSRTPEIDRIYEVLLKEWEKSDLAMNKNASLDDIAWNLPKLSVGQIESRTEQSIHVSRLHLLADRDCLTISSTTIDESEYVTFSQPFTFMYLIQKRKTIGELPFKDMVAMIYPFGELGIHAEKVLMQQIIHTKCEHLPISVDNGRKIYIGPLPKKPGQAAVSLRESTFSKVEQTTLENLDGNALSPAVDKFGFDRMVVSVKKQMIYLIQIKLCATNNSIITLGSEATASSAKQIVHLLKRGQVILSEDLEMLGTAAYTIQMVLITNRIVNSDSMGYFNKNGIVVWNREALFPVWSDQVKNLDYGRGIYRQP